MLQQIHNEIANGHFFSPWVLAPLIVLLSVSVLLALKKGLLALVRGYIAQRSSLAWAESLIEALSPALTIAVLAAGIALLDRTLPLSSRSDRVFEVAVDAAFILALIVFADRISHRLLDRVA